MLRPSPQSGPPCAGADLSEDALDLRESFLYRVEIRKVGRQVDELAVSIFDQLPYPPGPVGSEVVHYHNATRPEGGSQYVLHVSFEDASRGRPSRAMEGPIPSG